MALDFRASQFRGAKFIASGSTGTGASLIFYPIAADSTTTPNIGTINTAKFGTGSIGTDIFLFVSGGISQKDSSNSHAVSVFGGDVHVSGNLTIGGSGGGTSYWYSTSSNVIFTTGSVEISGSILLGLGGSDYNRISAKTPPTGSADPKGYSLLLQAATPPASGSGGSVELYAGDSGADTKTKAGGAIVLQAGDGSGIVYSNTANFASEGGDISIVGGTGGTALFNINGGTGGDISIAGGAGGDCDAQPGTGLHGGTGGTVVIGAGNGGSGVANEADGYQGGNLTLESGAGGDAAGGAGGAGGDAGDTNLFSGNGGIAEAHASGEGGYMAIAAGTGGANLGSQAGGAGGYLTVLAGWGGDSSAGNAGDGGYLNVGAGSGGFANIGGNPGDGGSLGLFAGDAGTIQDKTSGAYATAGDVYIYPGAPSYDNSSHGNGKAGNVFIQGRSVLTSSHALSGSFLEIGGYVGTQFFYQNYGFSRVFINASTSPGGAFPTFPGTDIFFFVSGTKDGRGVTSGSVAVFGGDVIISGNLYYNNTRKYTEFMTIGSYTATTLTSSNPQVAGQAVISQSEVPSSSIILRSVLSTTTGSVTASLRLFNINSGTYVHIGGVGVTTLNTVSTTPTQLQSVNLLSATNFGTGSNIYEVQVHIGTGSQQAVLGSSMFVCT